MGRLSQIRAAVCLTALSASMAAANPLHLFRGTAPAALSQTSADILKVSTSERSFTAYITGYSYWDNTPPGSAAIARPVLHQRAGGMGTYRDPVTIAVGYRLVGGKARLDYPAGTRFYLPHLSRYAIVEDICGDGPNPDVTGCAHGNNGHPWLDVYVDGSGIGASAAYTCMSRLTGFHPIIINPRDGYPVSSGPIAESGCTASASW